MVTRMHKALLQMGIPPAINQWTHQPMIWLTGKFLAVEVESESHKDELVELFERVFEWVEEHQMDNGNWIVKGELPKGSSGHELFN